MGVFYFTASSRFSQRYIPISRNILYVRKFHWNKSRAGTVWGTVVFLSVLYIDMIISSENLNSGSFPALQSEGAVDRLAGIVMKWSFYSSSLFCKKCRIGWYTLTHCIVLYCIVLYCIVHWNTPSVEESSCPCVGRYSLGNISLQR